MDRVTPPSFLKSLTFSLPSPETTLLPGEIELIYLPSSLSEVVKIEFVFKAGKIHEPSLGVAQFVCQLLDKGIPGKNARQIATLLDYYGAHLESQAGFDFTSISLYCLRKDVKHLLPLFMAMLTEPTFPEDELESHRRISIQNLKINLQKNSFLASNEIRRSLFKNHAYGSSTSISDIEKINRSLLISYYKSHYSPIKIFIVGSIEVSDLNYLNNSVDKNNFNSFHRTKSVQNNDIKRTDINGPNKTQSSIRLGKRVINRNHPDIAGITLVNHMLGGFFGSRLMKNIREEKGLTYGIHSAIQHLEQASWLTIAAEVNAEKAEEAITEIKKELDNLSILTEVNELELCKNHLIGSLQSDTSTLFSAGERIKSISLNNLDHNYFNKLIVAINSITLKDVQKISSNHLSGKEMTTVVVK